MKRLGVHLDGTMCGYIEQAASGNLTFSYLDDYRALPEATPLSLSMPLVAQSYRKKEILPFIQGLLPDSEFALRAMGKRYGVSPKSPFALLEHMGADVAGAVQILPMGISSTDGSMAGDQFELIEPAEVARMLSQVIEEYESGIDYSGSLGHFSLAGAQPKIALYKKGSSWARPLGRTPTTHILKPVTGAMRHIDVVEHLTMKAARSLGNTVARTDLISVEGIDVFVTERYDRNVVAGATRRIHQEDLCQALSVSPDRKYQRQDGGPGVGAIAKLIASLRQESDRLHVGQAFYRAFVFNIVAGCTDSHAKNYSLILQGQNVHLAPLYDLSSYAAYWDGRSPVLGAMSVAGEYRLDRISEQMLVELGKNFGLSDEAAEIVEQTRNEVFVAFETARDELVEEKPKMKKFADGLLSNVRALPLVK